MGKSTFVFHTVWKEAIENLPNDLRLEIYECIIEYATSGSVGAINPMANIAFNFIKRTIDRDIKRSNRNRENGIKGADYGKLGGRPRKEINPQKPRITPSVVTKPQITPNEDAKPPNNPEKPPITPSVDAKSPITTNEDTITPNNLQKDDNKILVAQNKILNYKLIIDDFNFVCKSLSKVNIISEERKNKIRLRFLEMKKSNFEPYSTFNQIFTKMENSNFCTGRTEKDWQATFDWVIENGTNWLKVYEGNYDNRAVNQKLSTVERNLQNAMEAIEYFNKKYEND